MFGDNFCHKLIKPIYMQGISLSLSFFIATDLQNFLVSDKSSNAKHIIKWDLLKLKDDSILRAFLKFTDKLFPNFV